MTQTFSFFRNLSLVVLSLSLVFASCSKKDGVDAAPTAAFSGNYTVADETETYTLKVESKGGNKFQIKNFGGFLNVPINAEANGNNLTIPSQTFTNPNGHTLTVEGTGMLTTKDTKDDTIYFTYKVSGFANYTGDFEGSRN